MATLINPLTANFTILTSGQFQIPAGSALLNITAVSGGFYVNGTGPFCPPTAFFSNVTTLLPLNVGCTGGNTAIFYQK
jgi:hypothetical protein